MTPARPIAFPGLLLRVTLFVFLGYVTLGLLSPLLISWSGYLVAATLSTFGAAAIANAILVRIFERGRLADIGMAWTGGSARNLGIGVAGGIGAAVLVLGGPLILGVSELRPAPDQPGSAASFLFVSIVLLFGAVGEEMLFRGYGFQILISSIGTFSTILPTSVLFALAHAGNLNVSWLGLFNTFGWGVLFGFAFLRSGDLWLPIGLHFGWNWTLPLFGVSLSGFTMGVTGYALHWKVGEIWSGGDYGPEASVLTCAVLPLLAWCLWKAPIQTHRPFLLRTPEEVE